ncbi:MAG: hypothetical protein K6F09_08605 [Clostridiales bacterium]|nr:hypothetical protein [Clostridiales bacterium]
MNAKLIESLKEALHKVWHNKYRLLAVCIVMAVILSVFHFILNGSTASVQLALNYSEASKGLNPNSTLFNINEFVSDEVMTAAINSAGLDGKIKPDELAKGISIYPSYANGDDELYISTTYRIVYNSRKSGVSRPDAMNMLKIICSAYTEYFLNNYGDSSAALSFQQADFSMSEPYLKLVEFQIHLDRVERYVEQRISESTSFIDKDTGYSFLSVKKMINQMNNYDIPAVFAYVKENSVAANSTSLISTLEFKNIVQKIDYDKLMAFYGSDNMGIKLYDTEMSGIVLIPTVDEKNEYYMSRTRTALDDMAQSSDKSLQDATDIRDEIEATKYVIKQIKEGNESAVNLKEANRLVDELEKTLDGIVDKLCHIDTAYIKYKTQNYITYNYDVTSTLSRLDVTKTAAEIFVFLSVCFGVFFIRALVKKTEEGRK